ncbi:MAG: putative Ig domain-containing protein [Actinobacteria bacterium]|nr:putative Ig domain-containing protein [Actinomycetota bacterium]
MLHFRALFAILLSGILLVGCGGDNVFSPSIVTEAEAPIVDPDTGEPVAAAPLSISTSTLPSGAMGIGYVALLNANGGVPPYSWAIDGALGLPDGVDLASNGIISGTPTESGIFNFAVRVTDAADISRLGVFGVSVSTPSAPSISTSSLGNWTLDVSNTVLLEASGGALPYTWSLAAGDLPDGVGIGTNGWLSGIPTESGTFAFIVALEDNNQAVTYRQFSLVVEAPSAPTINAVSGDTLAIAKVGVSYAYMLRASGGIGPYLWTDEGGMPPGLTLDLATGILSGVPMTSGEYILTVSVEDANNEVGLMQFTIVVTDADVPAITTTALPEAELGVLYAAILETDSDFGPFEWAVVANSLPVGLDIADSANGIITGTPTQAGAYSFVVSLEDNNGNIAYALLHMVVNGPGEIVIHADDVTSPGTVGNPYIAILTAQGIASDEYAWNVIGDLPSGLTLEGANQQTATLQGVPDTADTYTFIIELEVGGAGDSGYVDHKQFTITIN